jgi:hypothetical protein
MIALQAKRVDYAKEELAHWLKLIWGASLLNKMLETWNDVDESLSGPWD